MLYEVITPAIALERLSQRKENKERFETLAQLEKIRSAYDRILPKETIRIDGVKGPDEIVQECLEIFLRNFNRKLL